MTKNNDDHTNKPMYTKHFLDTSVSSVKAQNIIALVIILFFAGVNILSVRRGYSQTRDEDKHYQYGENILAGNSSRFDDSKMPISALNALPAKITQLSGNDQLIRIGGRFYIARSVTILFSCFVAFLVFYWARVLYGFIPAVFSLLLYILDPNIIAHSQLVTTDLYAVGTIAFAFYCLWRFANDRTLHNGLWCAFALGISQIAKYTAVALFPLFLISLILYDLFVWNRRNPGKYAWLRNNFEPDDTIAYTYLIYNISPEELDAMCEATDYCQ